MTESPVIEKRQTDVNNNLSSVEGAKQIEENFKDLLDKIRYKEMWSNQHFEVFNYEAGTGKSRITQLLLGLYTQKRDDSVLYVQKFSRDGELQSTVDRINEYAKCEVAAYLDSQDNKGSKKRRREKLKSQILVITHRMYEQVCYSEHEDIISGRQILIIDEFPDILDRIKVEMSDIQWLWSNSHKFINSELIEMLARELRDQLHRFEKDPYYIQNVPYYSHEVSNGNMVDDLEDFLSTYKKSEDASIVERILFVLKNGCFYNNQAFHTFNDNVAYKMLDNNIILDANGGLDARYNLSSLFQVKEQPKKYNYSNSSLIHYDVKTSKESLSNYVNFYYQVLEKEPIDLKQRTLFITDKNNFDDLRESLIGHLSAISPLKDPEMLIDKVVSIDYFGNIIGVNTYQMFDKVVILKTPNFDYIDYVLQSHFFDDNEQHDDSISMFNDERVEPIRLTMIAGEFYQALKRINRDNQLPAQYVLFTDNSQAVDMIESELPGINRYDYAFKPKTNQKETESGRQRNWRNCIRDYLLQCKKEGRTQVTKKELRDNLGLQDNSNLSKYLKDLQYFMSQHGIEPEHHHIVFRQ
ncbi:hypothetical protein [Alkalibacillus salilacus]|uniref:Uncharacterized protein n=1 Tax=Alkalibacillus salilacus TaxID=284582 RepID=A0ABT9VIK5_9BACI|nr:hypothetical protein [Alkalibacillus salilacus]MDQ0160744.1 hypothetical protein [Alkalibacillus salilacus]